MDPAKLVEMLSATLDPHLQEQARKQLDEVHKIFGFPALLLQLLSSDQVVLPVRQAGVVYFKNMVHRFWEAKETENPGEPMPFNIHEQDRANIRQNVIGALIAAPLPIRSQLAVVVSNIIKSDFPQRWPGIVDQVGSHLQSDNVATWLGALITLHQLIKHYEYKSNSERGPLNQAMTVLLPIIHARCKQLVPEQSEQGVLIKKQVLKCFYTLIQYTLPLELITRDAFSQWMELVREIFATPLPEGLNALDKDDLPEAAWWKIKKWCLHIMVRTFERYGSPGSVVKEYNKFAEWYLRTFVPADLNLILNLLKTYQQQYITPRCLQQALYYANQGVNHGAPWKTIKPHMEHLLVRVLFPLLCHSDEDQELWECDPAEYIRTKYDVFEEFLSPTMAAQTMLVNSCTKRKQVLSMSLEFCMGVLRGEHGGPTPRQKDGVLHILGSLSSILLKKELYKSQVEELLTTYVYPEFRSEHGYLRARACWSLQYFVNTKFKDMSNLGAAVELTRQCLCEDKELPVRVEAAIALQSLIESHEPAYEYIKPNLKPILLQLLELMKETENEELTGVMQNLVQKYEDEVIPISVEIITHLATIFQQVVESGDQASDSDDRVIMAMGVLNTVETVLGVIEASPDIMETVEPIIIQIIDYVVTNSLMEYYEEVLQHVTSLTSISISPAMWQRFSTVYEMFLNDGYDYFAEMLPCLHNYVTVDPGTFASDPKNLEMVYNMCKQIMTTDSGEDAECHAAKLIEVLLLQYQGLIDSALPLFVTLALERLTRDAKTSELRAMCLQVVIAGLYYDTKQLFEILKQPNVSEQSVVDQFIKQWLHDTDCFLGLHDRKICVLGLCSLMNTPSDRPQVLNEIASQIIPAALLVFKGLKRAYQVKADRLQAIVNHDSDEELESENGEVEELDDDEDEIVDEDSDSDSDDCEDDDCEETQFECYTTILESASCDVDEYQVFKDILSALHSTDPGWYSTLTSHLDKQQQKEVQEVLTTADQRKALRESQKIELQGGFQYQNMQVPASFNFGGAPPQL